MAAGSSFPSSRALVPVTLVVLLGLVLAACSASGDSPLPVQASPVVSAASSALPSPTATPSASVSASPAAIPSPVERTATVAASIPLGGHGTRMALGDGSVWVRFADGSVARVDTKTGKVGKKIPVGTGEFGSLAVGDGAVWVTTFDENKVSRIDPATNKVVAEISVGTNPEGITVTPEAVWVSNHRAGSISRIDPATNTVVATITFGRDGPSGPKDIKISNGSLWTSVPNLGSVIRIDQATNEVLAKIRVENVEDLVAGSEAVYAYGAKGLYEIDPASNEVVRTVKPDVGPWMFADGAYWGSDGKDILRLAPDTFDPIERLRIAGTESGYADLAIADGSAWVMTEDGMLLRVDLSE